MLLSYTNVRVNEPDTDPEFFDRITQNESATIAFRTSPTSQPIVLTSFNDKRFYADKHGTGWARSTDGGRNFVDQGSRALCEL